MPEVSVIIPNYNHERYLQQRIRSVLDQTFTDIEVIILDDCSTDGSRNIIEQYRNTPRITHIAYNETNGGSPFRQWEKGMLLATGNWVWVAESDDYCEPNFLERLMALKILYDNVGIAFCRSHWVDAHGTAGEELAIYKKTCFLHGQEALKEMVIHCTVQNTSSCIVRRSYALQAIKGLDKYKACGDWVYYTRILNHANLLHCGEQLNYFRWYHDNISSKAKHRLWITEGIDVLKNIDFKLVPFTSKDVVNTARYWKWKASGLSFTDKMSAWRTIALFLLRYMRSGKNAAAHTSLSPAS